MPDIVYTVIVLVLLAAGAGLFSYYMYRKHRTKAPGAKGRENRAARAVGPVRRFARSNRFRFIAPYHMRKGGAETRLDAVAVGYFGVLGLIALGYNGQIYGEANDKNWVQVSPDGKRQSFRNPLLECSAAVRALREALSGSPKLKKVPVEVVCAFTAPEVQLALPRSIGALTVKDLKKRLAKEKYMEDTGLEPDEVESALRAAAAAAPDA